jgi:multiple sugar transport system ATP-binding protein
VASIEFEHVTKRYNDGFEAVRDMTLSVADGEFMILVGPSGSGKSTALRMVAGLEGITEGELRIGGEAVNDRSPRDRNVAMVFQSSALYSHMTVRENIGGALVRSPSAFLMDEPLSNLDAQLRVQTRIEIARIHQQLGTTTLYATHDQIEALTLGDRIAVMRAGVLQQVGPPGRIYGHPDNLFVAGFIGSPSMNFLRGHLDGERLSVAISEVRVPDRLRRRLRPRLGATPLPVIVGIRPEHFEDASLVGDRPEGHTFKTRIDALESVGSEYYAHFTVLSERVSSPELEELAQHNGTGEARRLRQGVPMVARLGGASRIRQGQVAELWFDPMQVQLFDDESGQNLLVSDGER